MILRRKTMTDNDDGHQRREAIALAGGGYEDLVFDRIKITAEHSPKDGG